ncbi:MAG: hypothetical protein PWR22_1799 [Moorella sp. (in: firmicutes)]|jgi:hypothetical protein|nr:hypothetical protein [Moorella sp. (in: firmicutes)]GEA15925.1 hypothetical protein E308F_21690 [Moorella sp. E308F]
MAKILGIFGGMGPEAMIELSKQLLLALIVIVFTYWRLKTFKL